MAAPGQANRHRGILLRALVVCALMFAFGFAIVPLYRVLCDVTGINGRMALVSAAETSRVDTARLVTVQFVANRNQDLPWDFQPDVQSLAVHPGEMNTVTYLAHNLNAHPMVGRAIPSVAPGEAAKYLRKVECFCFSEQAFEAGETRHMPVRFYIDAALPPEIGTITLSYTFFDAGKTVPAGG